MFICSTCKTPQPPNIRARRAITHRRRVEYRLAAGALALGHEIIKEVMLCPTCPDPEVVEVVANGGVAPTAPLVVSASAEERN